MFKNFIKHNKRKNFSQKMENSRDFYKKRIKK